MYIYEGPEGINPKIINFFDAIYWSIITILIVGYGDVTPITSEGKFVTGILIVTSFLVIAFVASEYLGQPVAFEAIDGILLNKDIKVIIDEVEISDNSKIIGKNINLINFKDYNLTLIGVINPNKLEEFIFNSSNLEHIVQKKDILLIIGFKSSISQLKVDLINLDFKV